MGHDVITYEGDHELFNDFDLWTLRHFFLEEARVLEASAGSDARALREFVEGWNWVCPGVFTGTDLSGYVQESRIRWELLLELLHRAADRVAKFGEVVPLDYLKTNVSTPMAYFTKDQSTRPYLDCIDRICKLVRKHDPESL